MKTFIFFFVMSSMVMNFKLEAQDQPIKIKEFGIGLTGLNSFSLQHRWGNDKRLFRISFNIGGTTSNGNNGDSYSSEHDTIYDSTTRTSKTTTPINLTSSIGFSILKIKMVSDKFGFIYGGITTFLYSIIQSKTDGTSIDYGNYNPQYNSTTKIIRENKSQTIQPSIGIAMGAVYKINESFLLYAEIDPNIYYSYHKSKMTSTETTTYSNYIDTETYEYPDETNSFGLANLSNTYASLTIVYRIRK